jgi:hypothetical protein
MLIDTHYSHALAVGLAVVGGSIGLFIAGCSPMLAGVLERMRSMLSGSAWTLGLLGTAVLFVFWQPLTDWTWSPAVHPTVTTSFGSTTYYSPLSASSMSLLLRLPVCLAVLGVVGLFFERTFLRIAFGDRPRRRWFAPLASGLIFAVVGSLTTVFVPMMLYFLIAGSIGFGRAPAAGAIFMSIVALLTGFASGCAIGFGISRLR